MTRLNVIELAQQWTGARADSFLEIYPYVVILRGSYVDEGWIPTADLVEAFTLSGAGEVMLARVMDSLPGIDGKVAKMGVILSFAYDELFVDVERTVGDEIATAMSREIRSGTLHFYQEYGRLLYDRFFDLFPTRTDKLNNAETMALVEGTQQTAYQFGRLTVGPLGVLTSTGFREFAPQHDAPLWHCSDPGCSALHTVRLGAGPLHSNPVAETVRNLCARDEKDRSEWEGLFYRLSSIDRGYYSESNLARLPYLLVDAFDEDELRTILRDAFALEPRVVRDALCKGVDVNRPVERIISEMGPGHVLQALLLLTDEIVARSIDKAVTLGAIKIPPTEVRKPMLSRRVGTWWGISQAVSSLGLRSTSMRADYSILRLQRLILASVKSSDSVDSLEWALRFTPGRSLDEKIAHEVLTSSPRSLIRKFSFASAESLSSTLEILQPFYAETPRNEEEENLLVERILWKLGFPVVRRPIELETFWRRHWLMRDAIPTGSGPWHSTVRDEVRSAAVNYFVSLEAILDQTLAFAGWTLLHDHYGSATTPFSFELNEARLFVASFLEAEATSEAIHESGRNTLWPLIYNLGFLAKSISTASGEAGGKATLRGDMPDFAVQGAAPFPFRHHEPWRDLTAESLEEICGTLSIISTNLASLDVPNLRNRMQHHRPDDEFPTSTELSSALETIAAGISSLEAAGIVPMYYTFSSGVTDEYARSRVTVVDYSGRTLEIAAPTGTEYCRMPALKEPQLIVRAARLKGAQDCLRLSLREDSSYRRRWSDYPRRRLRMRTEEAGQP